MAKKLRRVKLSTLLIVGEGLHDKAFINHLKFLYDNRNYNQKVKVKSADGGSPYDIIKSAQKNKNVDYDKKYVLMDSDIPLTQQDRDFAKKHNINIIQSAPYCLEGMLLGVLGEHVPNGNQGCKQKLHPMLSGDPTLKDSYTDLFPKSVVDNCQKEPLLKLRQIVLNI